MIASGPALPRDNRPVPPPLPSARLNSDPDSIDDDAPERPSKTAQKKAMHELQALGVALMALPDARLAAVPMPESLRDAVRAAVRTRSFEGKRRQVQYVGKLMRKAQDAGEIDAIREAVAAFELGQAQDALALHEAERWRAELLASDDALTRWTARHPASDVQQLRQLIRNARKEAAAPAPAGTAPRQGRAYRELFQQVRRALNATDAQESSHE